MSGGVDSSVVAALLLQEGYEVAGAFMKNWSDEADACSGGCGWQTEREAALKAAATLGIPFFTFDFEAEYRARVVDYMVREYAAGRTPNPDVMCNKEVKFDLFLREAERLGYDLIATGHYARVVRRTERAADGSQEARFALLAGVDTNKDQSYFLHRLDQAQLARTLFPVGHLEKPRVRELAREFGLPNAEKKDSQGICFIGQVDLREFLSAKLTPREGPILSKDGHVLGRHDGAAAYTIGQRQGIRIGGGAPYFVVEKDVKRNTITVDRDPASLMSSGLIAEDVHWISGNAPSLPLECEVRIRYRQPLQKCRVSEASDGSINVDFGAPQRAVSPGQFAVFYEGAECLGGAVISTAV